MGVMQPIAGRRWYLGAWGLGWVMVLGASGVVAQTNPVPPNPVLTAPPVQRSILRRGSQGPVVAELQGMLRLLGYYRGPVTGTYDEATAIAVSQFQTAAGLTADGVAGTETWKRLFPEPRAVTGEAPTVTVPNPPGARSSSSPVASGTTAAAFPVPGVSRGNSIGAGIPPTGPATTPRQTNPSVNPTTRRNPTTSASSMSNAAANFPVLRLGMQGPEVIRLQQRLRTWGFFTGPMNGNFGPMTQTAVIAAQQRFKLTADGVVGAETWRALLRSPR